MSSKRVQLRIELKQLTSKHTLLTYTNLSANILIYRIDFVTLSIFIQKNYLGYLILSLSLFFFFSFFGLVLYLLFFNGNLGFSRCSSAGSFFRRRKGLAGDVFGTLATHADLDDDVTDTEKKDWLVTYLVPCPHMPTLMMTSLTQRKGLASDVFGTLATHADLDDVTDTEKRTG